MILTKVTSLIFAELRSDAEDMGAAVGHFVDETNMQSQMHSE